MLVEIPDPEVILGVLAAFFVGLFGLYFYIKIKPHIKFKPGTDQPGRNHDRGLWTRMLTPDGEGFKAGAWQATRLQP